MLSGSSTRSLGFGLAMGLAVASLSNPASASDDFVVAPYLQHLGASRVQIRFETSDEVVGSVEVRKAGDRDVRRFKDAAEREMHDILVDGLSPATSYTYVVRADDAASAPATFTTAPEDASKPFTFLLMGDNRDDAEVHAELVQAMLRVPSDFVVHTGDLVGAGRDREAWLEYFRVAGPLLSQRCEFVAMGNHDLDGKGPRRREPFLKYFASPNNPSTTYYTFRWANSRFFVLDTKESFQVDQGPWLRDQLDKSDNEPGLAHRVAVLHHSPFSTGKHGPNREIRQAGILHAMLQHRVDLVLAGHDHMYERGRFGGMKYVISGGGGAPLYGVEERAAADSYSVSAYHFVQVRVQGDQVQLAAYDARGNVFDAAAYEGTGAWISATPPAAGSGTGTSRATARLPAPLPPRASSCGCSIPGERRSEDSAPPWVALIPAIACLLRARRSGRGAPLLTRSAKPSIIPA